MTGTRCPLAACAESRPGSVAVQFPGGQLTFQQLDSHANQLAFRLREIGVHQGSRVAFVATRRWQDIALLWAVWRVHAIACPISPRLPLRQPMELASQIDAHCMLDSMAVDALLANSAMSTESHHARAVELDFAATILFSSGTTNVPKAIVHSLAAHLASARGSAANIPLRQDDRWLASIPFFHVGGVAILVRTILAGAAVILPTPSAPLGELIRDQGVTHCSIVATQLRQLLQASATELASLKCVLLGGGPCSNELLDEAIAKDLPLRTTYGLTEMASQVTATAEGCGRDRITTAGQVLPERELRIENGEILVRGPTLCLGYLRDGAVVPAVDEDGWFHTGDAGSLDRDGFLSVTGRLDQMFISGGENIHPEAVEQCLLTLPGIRQVVVVPVDDREYGQRPVAFVDAAPFVPNVWEQAMRDIVPSYMIPDAWFPWPDHADGETKISRYVLKVRAKELHQK